MLAPPPDCRHLINSRSQKAFVGHRARPIHDPRRMLKQTRKMILLPKRSDRGPQTIGAGVCQYAMLDLQVEGIYAHMPCMTRYTVTVWFIASVDLRNTEARVGIAGK